MNVCNCMYEFKIIHILAKCASVLFFANKNFTGNFL